MGLNNNLLLHTDVYKMGHLVMYPKNLTKMYSYLIPRSSKKFPNVVFFGLQYFIQEYLDNPAYMLTQDDIEEFLELKTSIVGPDHNDFIRGELESLMKEHLHWPIRIEAVPEGTVMPVGNVLATFESLDDRFPWVGGFVESVFLKVWNTSTVATNSLRFRQIAQDWASLTCDNAAHVDYQVHDFGYRGCSSEETAMLSGMAHLLSFYGTDTVLAVAGAKHYYAAENPIGLSVPASEHSVVCSFGQAHEYEAMDNILSLYPTGILSMVSDTYNVWNILTDYASTRKERILSREGKVVFRPDGGYPPHIVAGDPTAISGSVERKGAVELLGEVFGYTTNSKGYKELNPKVGVIFGEGMTHDRFNETCQLLRQKGWASNNFVIGVGGLLLQSHTRDDMGFALKATYAERGGEPINLLKNPITSPNKKSHSGKLALVKTDHGWETHTRGEGEDSGLELVYESYHDHIYTNPVTFNQIRQRVRDSIKEGVLV